MAGKLKPSMWPETGYVTWQTRHLRYRDFKRMGTMAAHLGIKKEELMCAAIATGLDALSNLCMKESSEFGKEIVLRMLRD